MKQKLFAMLIVLLTAAASFNVTQAQPCTVPCSGPWTDAQQSFTATYNGCLYNFIVRYRYRPCMGAMQIEFTGGCCFDFIVESLSGCPVHCIDAAAFNKIVYNKLITVHGMPILHAAKAPCHYTGTIIVPPAAEACMGMTPGTQRYIVVPCNTNGCCYSKLEALPNNGIYQTVLQSSACPPPPSSTPSSFNVDWSCDIVGGGYMTFTVPFTPDVPLTCTYTCTGGPYYFGGPPAKPGTTRVDEVRENRMISGLAVRPNPVGDKCAVSFSSRKQAEKVSIEILDISGKSLMNTNLQAKEGEQSIEIDTHELAPGVYTLKLTSGKEVYVHKIAK